MLNNTKGGGGDKLVTSPKSPISKYEKRVVIAFQKLGHGDFEIGSLAKFGPYKGPMARMQRAAKAKANNPLQLLAWVARCTQNSFLKFHPIFRRVNSDLGAGILGVSSNPHIERFATADMVEPNLGKIRWLWPGWLLQGQVIVLGAQAGKGKSALAMRLCVSVATGECWPDGSDGPESTGNVVWVETERREVLNAQRRQAFGVPAERMVVLKPRETLWLDNAGDLDELRFTVAKHKARLIVIDSLSAGHRSSENSPKVRRILQQLESIAADLRVAVLVVHHFRKQPKGKALDRLTIDELRGSSAIGDRAQSVIALDEPNPGERGHFRISHVKCSVGPERPSLGMRWGDDGELQFDFEPPRPTNQVSLGEEVGALLQDLLADGPKPATFIKEKVEAAKFNYETAKKVKASLGIKAVKKKDSWHWMLKK